MLPLSIALDLCKFLENLLAGFKATWESLFVFILLKFPLENYKTSDVDVFIFLLLCRSPSNLQGIDNEEMKYFFYPDELWRLYSVSFSNFSRSNLEPQRCIQPLKLEIVSSISLLSGSLVLFFFFLRSRYCCVEIIVVRIHRWDIRTLSMQTYILVVI